MRRFIVTLSFNLALAAMATTAVAREATPAPTAPTTPTTPPATVAKPAMDDPNRIVCKREHVVGSNRPEKVCMTVAQRAALRDRATRDLDPTRRSLADPALTGNAGM